MDEHLRELKGLYEATRKAAKADISSDETGRCIHDFALKAMRFLKDECKVVPLTSLVAGKRYFSFQSSKEPRPVSRPANSALFTLNPKLISSQWQAWWEGKLAHSDLSRLSYTIALAPCLAIELFDRQNKKQPATYFEWLIGHIFSKALNKKPHTKATLPIEARAVRMTMDFLFDMGEHSRKIHLPVKMSTRERVVQAWAHQRLLDAAYGANAYRGIMVLFSETKLDSRTLEVVEICVPDQWLAYQVLLSKMDRIYYFDVPNVYRELTRQYPDILPIKEFGQFFIEKEEVLRS